MPAGKYGEDQYSGVFIEIFIFSCLQWVHNTCSGVKFMCA